VAPLVLPTRCHRPAPTCPDLPPTRFGQASSGTAQRCPAPSADEVAIRPGKSMALQMDRGLRRAGTGVVVLTPAYLTGRFWTERELCVLLHKDTLIPILHNVTFDDVKEYSGILPYLAGFTTEKDTVVEIAAKIASAVLDPVP
jgi:hypothetical protein